MDFMVIQSNIFPTAYKKKKKHFELVKFGSFACISKVLRDFPGGPVVEDLLSSAGDKGSISGLGRSHMPWGQRSLCATTTEPLRKSPCSAAREAWVPQPRPSRDNKERRKHKESSE